MVGGLDHFTSQPFISMWGYTIMVLHTSYIMREVGGGSVVIWSIMHVLYKFNLTGTGVLCISCYRC